MGEAVGGGGMAEQRDSGRGSAEAGVGGGEAVGEEGGAEEAGGPEEAGVEGGGGCEGGAASEERGEGSGGRSGRWRLGLGVGGAWHGGARIAIAVSGQFCLVFPLSHESQTTRKRIPSTLTPKQRGGCTTDSTSSIS